MPPSDTTCSLPSNREPITHALETSASRLTVIYLWITAVIVGAGFALEVLRGHGVIARSDLTFFLILAALPFLGVAFNLVRSWRTWPEFRAMRRGDYLARWDYRPEMATLLEREALADQSWRVKLLFWIPFWVIFGSAFILGVIGAFAKSNPGLALIFSLNGLWSGALFGAIIAVPAHFLFGVARHIATRHEPVVIFTRSGFYTPGRFIPVMDFAQGRRTVSFEIGKDGSPSWLRFELRQGLHHITDRSTDTTAVYFEIPVPPECVDEARLLAGHYQS